MLMKIMAECIEACLNRVTHNSYFQLFASIMQSLAREVISSNHLLKSVHIVYIIILNLNSAKLVPDYLQNWLLIMVTIPFRVHLYWLDE